MLYSWAFISLDISAAFLQGLPIASAQTQTGNPRKVWCRPPPDVWTYLRRLEAEYGLGLPGAGKEADWLLLLLKAAYGLDDAPLLWRTELADRLKS